MDLTGLIPSFGNIVLTILAFLVALIPIVLIHELGHYLVGRWSGIKADVFSIGAGPRLASRVDRHGTRWQIAAFPVGGYVRFHGDANAASGSADEAALATMSAQELRSTLHGAPLWARAATVAAGPVSNFILSAVIFTSVALWSGIASDPLTVAKAGTIGGVETGLQAGDEILAIAGARTPPLEDFADYVDALPNESPLDWLVRRDGQELTLTVPHPYPPIVGGLTPQSAAVEAGLEIGDLIETVNGQPVETFEQLRDIVGDGAGATVTLGVNRDGTRMEVTLTPRHMDLPLPDGGFETRWLIGVSGGLLFEPATRTPGIVEAAGIGAGQVGYIVKASISGIYHMVTGAISSCNLRGPIGIAETSGQAASQGATSFIWFVAVLSTAVGLLNLFPIPVLDGGHLMFHAWEAVTGRPPNDRVLGILTTIGLAIVIGIMVLGVSNDLFCA